VPLVPWGLLIATVALYALVLVVIALIGRGEQARTLARFVPALAVLMTRLSRDQRVPLRRRAVLGVLAVYLAMPIDLIPDFIPVAGQIDDAVLTAVALRFVLRGSNEEVLREAWPGPDASLRLVMRAAGIVESGRRQVRL
jgi:uncharacterized membrane protein YkvA (DUF1232 family)